MANFSKSLTKTDVAKRLSVPSKFVKHLLQVSEGSHKVEILAKDECGFLWSFECCVRRHRHPKPVLAAKNWLAFVRFKNLQRGDKLHFYGEEDEFTGAQFRIQVERE